MEVGKCRNRAKARHSGDSWLRSAFDRNVTRIEPPKRPRRRGKLKRPAKGHAPKQVQRILPKPGPESTSNPPPSARLSPSKEIGLTLPPPDTDACAEESVAPASVHSSASPETATSINHRPSRGFSPDHHHSQPNHVLTQPRADGFSDHMVGNSSPSTAAPVLPEHRPPEGRIPTPQPILALEHQDAPTPESIADAWRCSTPENNTSAMAASDVREEQEAQRYQDHIPVVAKFHTQGGKVVNRTAIFDPKSDCGTVNPSTARELGMVLPFKPGRSRELVIACNADESPGRAEGHQVAQGLRHSTRSPTEWTPIQVEFPWLGPGRFNFSFMVREDDLKIANVVFGIRSITFLRDHCPGFEAQLPSLCGNIPARNTIGVSGSESQTMVPAHNVRLASQQTDIESQHSLPPSASVDSPTCLGDPSERLSSSDTTLYEMQYIPGSDPAPLMASYSGLEPLRQGGSSQDFAQFNFWDTLEVNQSPPPPAHMSPPQTIYRYPQPFVHYPLPSYVETYYTLDGLSSQPAEPAWAYGPPLPSWHDLNMQGGN